MGKKPRKKSETTTHLARVIERNIDTLLEVRKQMDTKRRLRDRIAERITFFAGSTGFFLFHVLWFGLWIVTNLGIQGIEPFDPFPYGLLTMIVSLEAIFLSTFILITQKRMEEISDQRADLDLQITLLNEYETTKILNLVDAIADHLGLQVGKDEELEELKKEISPDVVLQEMEGRKLRANGGK